MESLISVIMSVHNEHPAYLKCAIDSICNQTYKKFEFIIIDDASDEECFAYLSEISLKDKRIRLYRNSKNIGLTKTLNKGLMLAKGEYIARMDADDFSLPKRFEKQISYLKTHTNIAILGTGVVSFGEANVFMSPMRGLTPQQAKCQLFFTSSLCHPSVMIRKDFLDKFRLTYAEDVKKGQDFDMWERSSVLGDVAVMQEVLLYYRLHKDQITSKSKNEQDNTAEMVMKRRLYRIGINPTDKEYRCHLMLKRHQPGWD